MKHRTAISRNEETYVEPSIRFSFWMWALVIEFQVEVAGKVQDSWTQVKLNGGRISHEWELTSQKPRAVQTKTSSSPSQKLALIRMTANV